MQLFTKDIASVAFIVWISIDEGQHWQIQLASSNDWQEVISVNKKPLNQKTTLHTAYSQQI